MAEDAAPPQYFLPGELAGDDDAFVAAARQGNKIEPLIGGKETFESLASAIQAAQHYVYLTCWTIEPQLKVAERRQEVAGSSSKKSPERADIRVLISDMDPLGNAWRHYLAWSAYRRLIDAAGRAAAKANKKRSPSNPERRPIEAVVTLHNSAIGLGLGSGAIAGLVDEFNDVLSKNASRERLKNMPLLWPHFSLDGKTPVRNSLASIDVHIATHHQKLCIVDGRIAFCGGIDITAGRDVASWQDVHCKITGPVVADFERNFTARWNLRRSATFENLLPTRTILLPPRARALGFEIPLRSATHLDRSTRQAGSGRQRCGADAAHIVGDADAGRYPPLRRDTRTSSSPRPFALTVMMSNEDTARPSARRRSSSTSRIWVPSARPISALWIERRLKEVPALRVIVTVPLKPEEKDPLLSRHGNWLQHRNIVRLFARRRNPGAVRRLQPTRTCRKRSRRNALRAQQGDDCGRRVRDHRLGERQPAQLSARFGSQSCLAAALVGTRLSVGVVETAARRTGGIFDSWKPEELVDSVECHRPQQRRGAETERQNRPEGARRPLPSGGEDERGAHSHPRAAGRPA